VNRYGQGITIAPSPERPFPAKEILWGSQADGCTHFPERLETITERKFSSTPTPLLAFGNALSEAQKRIWMVDEYLLISDKGDARDRIDLLLAWLPVWLVANDIRFLTKQHAEIDATALGRLEARAKDINGHTVRRPTQCTIEVRTHLTQSFNFIHDRFAIIDDELWHFGGSVGGFQSSVSAASRGWRASDHGAIEFFEMAWNRSGK
jgi:hypothetical protein